MIGKIRKKSKVARDCNEMSLKRAEAVAAAKASPPGELSAQPTEGAGKAQAFSVLRKH